MRMQATGRHPPVECKEVYFFFEPPLDPPEFFEPPDEPFDPPDFLSLPEGFFAIGFLHFGKRRPCVGTAADEIQLVL